jgi:hypothetical protein
MANFFPRWTNHLPWKLAFCGSLLGGASALAYWYYFTPEYSRVGYMPEQPVAFDHALHVDQLKMDCRYCHSFVDVSSHSNVPATETCMKCHSLVQNASPKLRIIRDSYQKGTPVKWVRIHQAPDYVYFNHAVHVNRGISCASCHGSVNQMNVVWHDQPHSMGWCLECHRNPEKHLRPLNEVYNLDWKPVNVEQKVIGTELKERWAINPPETCGGCHR